MSFGDELQDMVDDATELMGESVTLTDPNPTYGATGLDAETGVRTTTPATYAVTAIRESDGEQSFDTGTRTATATEKVTFIVDAEEIAGITPGKGWKVTDAAGREYTAREVPHLARRKAWRFVCVGERK